MSSLVSATNDEALEIIVPLSVSVRSASSLALSLLCLLGLQGCGIGTVMPSTSGSSSLGTISGTVHGGQAPVTSAHVYLYAVGTGGYGTGATSLLQPGLTTTFDGTNYYVTSGAVDGSFSVTGDYVCTAGQALYLYATGGSAGQGTNSAIGLLAALGTCPAGGSIALAVPLVNVNEVSTVVAAYALAGFAVSPTAIASSNTALAKTGVANAIANVANIMSIANGAAYTSTPGAGGTVPVAKINTLANVLAACINSTSSSSPNCTTLFTNTPTFSGTQPTDTAQAAINMAHVPGGATSSTMANLFALSSAQQAFVPSLTASPSDLALPIVYAMSNIGSVQGMAADAAGNIWASVGDSSNNHFPLLYKYSPQGAVTQTIIDPTYGISAMAISPNNQVWLVDEPNSAVRVYNSTATLLFSATGGGMSFPLSIAFDSTGDAFLTNAFAFKVSEFGPTGTPVSNGGYTTAASQYNAIGVDSANSLWLATSNSATYTPSAVHDDGLSYLHWRELRVQHWVG